jgi:ZIP family zinc transporter
MAVAIQERENEQGNIMMKPIRYDESGSDSGTNESDLPQPPIDRQSNHGDQSNKNSNGGTSSRNANTNNNNTATTATTNDDVVRNDHEHRKLMRMSLNTALAIGLHNFPEGLATFVAALNDLSVGAVLAVAIAIHNIPEGLCVALPIYYATGDRRKAFLWGILSGISEPIAALLGWAVLANAFSDTTYAILFGIVSGMMVIISVKELLPTAHRYDPEDSVTTYGFMVGMAVMALSLVLFRI